MDATKFGGGSSHYKAIHLQDGSLSRTISDVELVDFAPVGELDRRGKQKKEEKFILYFKDDPLDLALNLTNKEAVIARYGRDTDGWVDKDLTMILTTCPGVGGGMVDCIRLTFPPAAPAAAVAPATAEQPADLPF